MFFPSLPCVSSQSCEAVARCWRSLTCMCGDRMQGCKLWFFLFFFLCERQAAGGAEACDIF